MTKQEKEMLKVLKDALDFVEFVWRDVSLNEYAENKRHEIEGKLEHIISKIEFESGLH